MMPIRYPAVTTSAKTTTTSGFRSRLGRKSVSKILPFAFVAFVAVLLPFASAGSFGPPYWSAFTGTTTNSATGVGVNSYITPYADNANGAMDIDIGTTAAGFGSASYSAYVGMEGPGGALQTTKAVTVYYNWTVNWAADIVTTTAAVSSASGSLLLEANLEDTSTSTWVLGSNAVYTVWSESGSAGWTMTGSGNNAPYQITFPATLYSGNTYMFWSEIVVSTSVFDVALAYSTSTINMQTAYLVTVGTSA
ncbi:MAG: hypothetical protein L3K03_09590 [Thermoplasmata archaeon]|nr:hypothetical protein [Thermoplasmata archaeon]